MSIKLIIGYILGLMVLIAIIASVGGKNTTQTADSSDPDKPVAMVIGEKKFDFGAMTNADIRNKTFTVKNRGKKDLELTSVSTSCDCTYAYITIAGEKSPKFTMHGTNQWRGKVASGQTAEIEVIYEPAIMPVKGRVERLVSIATNDPDNKTLEFTITAEVSD